MKKILMNLFILIIVIWTVQTVEATIYTNTGFRYDTYNFTLSGSWPQCFEVGRCYVTGLDFHAYIEVNEEVVYDANTSSYYVHGTEQDLELANKEIWNFGGSSGATVYTDIVANQKYDSFPEGPITIPVDDYIPLDIINIAESSDRIGTEVLETSTDLHGVVIPFRFNYALTTEVDREKAVCYGEFEATIYGTGSNEQSNSVIWNSPNYVVENGSSLSGTYNGLIEVSLAEPVAAGEEVYVIMRMKSHCSATYTPIPICRADFDDNKVVDGADLAVFAAEFGRDDCP